MVNLRNRTAISADKVMVMRVLVQLVLDPPLPQIGLGHQADFRKQIEASVDRRFVEVWIARPHAAQDLLGGQMCLALANHREDALTLRRQPVTAGAQALDHFCVMRHLGYSSKASSCN